MKLNKIMLVAALAMGTASFGAFAADENTGMPDRPGAGSGGVVKFHGSIVDAPCSINPESDGQDIALGVIGNGALKAGGMSVPRPFTIKLEQCADDTKKSVVTTFNGTAGSGEATKSLALGMDAPPADGVIGASIVLLAADKSTILDVDGSKGVEQLLYKGPNDLNFFAAVKGDGKEDETHPIALGEFHSSVNFALTYQ